MGVPISFFHFCEGIADRGQGGYRLRGPRFRLLYFSDSTLLPDLLVLDFVGLDKTDPRFLAIGVLKRPNHDGIEPWREVENHG